MFRDVVGRQVHEPSPKDMTCGPVMPNKRSIGDRWTGNRGQGTGDRDGGWEERRERRGEERRGEERRTGKIIRAAMCLSHRTHAVVLCCLAGLGGGRGPAPGGPGRGPGTFDMSLVMSCHV